MSRPICVCSNAQFDCPCCHKPCEAMSNYAAHVWTNLVPRARVHVLCSTRPVLHDSLAHTSIYCHIQQICPPAHKPRSTLVSWASTACLTQEVHDLPGQLQARMCKPRTKASMSLQLSRCTAWRWQMDPSAEDSQPANSSESCLRDSTQKRQGQAVRAHVKVVAASTCTRPLEASMCSVQKPLQIEAHHATSHWAANFCFSAGVQSATASAAQGPL